MRKSRLFQYLLISTALCLALATGAGDGLCAALTLTVPDGKPGVTVTGSLGFQDAIGVASFNLCLSFASGTILSYAGFTPNAAFFPTIKIGGEDANFVEQVQERKLYFVGLSPAPAAGAVSLGQIRFSIPVGAVSGETHVVTLSGQTYTEQGTVADLVPVSQMVTVKPLEDPKADLWIQKTVDKPNPTVGQKVVFTVTAMNKGPDQATGVEVTDLLPAGLTYQAGTPSQGSYTSATGIWNIGTLNKDGVATLSLEAIPSQCGTLTNTAMLKTSSPADPDSTNNSANVSVNAQASTADIGLGKSASKQTPAVGEDITFTVTASNTGPGNATGVQVTDLLPTGLTYKSSAPSQGTYTPGTGLWNVGTIAASGSATLQITVTVSQAGGVTNTATVTASSPTDPNAANNTASVTVTGQAADLAVTKSVDQDVVGVGEDVVFTVTAKNDGPNDATGIQVKDLLPAGLTFKSANAPAGTTYTSGTGIWAISGLAKDATLTLTVTATVSQKGAFENEAERIASSPVDPNAANDAASATVTGGEDAVLYVGCGDCGGNSPCYGSVQEALQAAGDGTEIVVVDDGRP